MVRLVQAYFAGVLVGIMVSIVFAWKYTRSNRVRRKIERALHREAEKKLPRARVVRHFDSATKSCHEYGCTDDCEVANVDR